ncbi:hypothetical protein [Streptomyces bohaiensis]|uniref:hypothetical protein n=1 Tax=Streptomyces bohaiensis TaxID=1431344 RepID=UPI003B78F581
MTATAPEDTHLAPLHEPMSATPHGPSLTLSACGGYAARLATVEAGWYAERWTLDGPEPYAVPLPGSQPEDPGTEVLPLSDGRVLIARRSAGSYLLSLLYPTGPDTGELSLGSVGCPWMTLLPPAPDGVRAYGLVVEGETTTVWLVCGGGRGPQPVLRVPGRCQGGAWLDRSGRLLALNRTDSGGRTRAVTVDVATGGEAAVLLQIGERSNDRLLLADPDSGLLLVASDAPGKERIGWGVLGSHRPVRFPEALCPDGIAVHPLAVQPAQVLTPESCGVALRLMGPEGDWPAVWRPEQRDLQHFPAPSGWLPDGSRWTAGGDLLLPFVERGAPCGVLRLPVDVPPPAPGPDPLAGGRDTARAAPGDLVGRVPAGIGADAAGHGGAGAFATGGFPPQDDGPDAAPYPGDDLGNRGPAAPRTSAGTPGIVPPPPAPDVAPWAPSVDAAGLPTPTPWAGSPLPGPVAGTGGGREGGSQQVDDAQAGIDAPVGPAVAGDETSGSASFSMRDHAWAGDAGWPEPEREPGPYGAPGFVSQGSSSAMRSAAGSGDGAPMERHVAWPEAYAGASGDPETPRPGSDAEPRPHGTGDTRPGPPAGGPGPVPAGHLLAEGAMAHSSAWAGEGSPWDRVARHGGPVPGDPPGGLRLPGDGGRYAAGFPPSGRPAVQHGHVPDTPPTAAYHQAAGSTMSDHHSDTPSEAAAASGTVEPSATALPQDTGAEENRTQGVCKPIPLQQALGRN